MTNKTAEVFDLVCGMELNLEHVARAAEHKGETYYFCSDTCHDHFIADPEKYAPPGA